jgi:hypothetical protein
MSVEGNERRWMINIVMNTLSPQSPISPAEKNCSVSGILSVSVLALAVCDFPPSSYTICLKSVLAICKPETSLVFKIPF